VPDVATDEAVLDVWKSAVLPQLKPSVRPLFANAPVSVAGSVVHLAVPSEPYLKKCADHVASVNEILRAHFGEAAGLELSVQASAREATGGHRSVSSETSPPPEADVEEIDDIDLEDLVDAPAGSIGADKILEAFPGAVEEAD
jgi:hypothetical protein